MSDDLSMRLWLPLLSVPFFLQSYQLYLSAVSVIKLPRAHTLLLGFFFTCDTVAITAGEPRLEEACCRLCVFTE